MREPMVSLARRAGVGVALLASVAAIWIALAPSSPRSDEEGRVEPSNLDLLSDDRIEDKQPVFDPALVDLRPHDGWEINASAAVLRLDIPKGESVAPEMTALYPSYAAAARGVGKRGDLLPSVNSLDGKVKQFDDGLMAAVVAAGAPPGHARDELLPGILRRLPGRLPSPSAAGDWVRAALAIGCYADAKAQASPASEALVAGFLASDAAKPLAFYAWSADLERLWRFYRFLQQPLAPDVAAALREALAGDAKLAADYERMLAAWAQLTNPAAEPALLAPGGVFFLPPMGTPEDELFARLSAQSGAEKTELMQELVKAIRAGRIDLKPRPGSGWYDHQLHALETFLLPERGSESRKLLLTRAYKQRMLEAFKALITKRRETHGLAAAAAAAPRRVELRPRLRVEPNPTFYLRTARGYAFIEQALHAFFPPAELGRLRGLREGGVRDAALEQELARMKRLFYGFHLIACEDIGMRPEIAAGELAADEPAAAKAEAERYLADWRDDPDLAADTRVCAPVASRSWCTIGIKALALDVDYVVPPQARPVGSGAAWTEVTTRGIRYLVLVDEFAEVRNPGPITRRELRAVADREKTRDRIVAALGG